MRVSVRIRWRTASFLAVFATILVSAAPSPAAASTTLRIATLAPKQSPWGKVYSAWAKALEERTKGAVTVQVMWNGTAGPPSVVVDKIARGELDGGGIGVADLAALYPDAFALELPGTAKTWTDIDSVRASFQADIDTALAAHGVRFGWWEDGGAVRLFTRGRAIQRPQELVGVRLEPWFGAGTSVIVPAMLATAAASVPSVPTDPRGRPNAAFTTAVAAQALNVNYVSMEPLWLSSLAMVFGKDAFTALPPDLRQAVTLMNTRTGEVLRSMVRQQDDADYTQLARKLTVVRHSPTEAKEWDAFFRRVRARLASGTISKPSIDRVLRLLRLPTVP